MSWVANIASGPPTFSSVALGSVFKYNSGYPTKWVLGDSWQSTWADNDTIYVMSNDTFNWSSGLGLWANFRISSVDGFTTALTGTDVNDMLVFGGAGATGPDGFDWKASGIVSVGGVLYCSIFRMTLSSGVDWTQENSAQIIKSTDHGVTWTPLPPGTALPYVSPMFSFASHFCGANFIQYGKDYQSTGVHRSNEFVYAVSPDRLWEQSDHLNLGRVRITDIGSLDATKWSFYKGGGADGSLDANWDSNASLATPIITSTGKIASSNVQYLPYYDTYVYISFWYGNTGTTNSTSWDWYKSRTPWGPWTKFQSTSWPTTGLFSAHIVPKSVAANGGRSVTIFCSGDYQSQASDTGEYTLQVIPAVFG